MSELISGKDALIALGNGEDVEYYKHEWMDVNRLSVRDLTSPDSMYEFRLKPKTITINGVEVPAPFNPNNDCVVYIIDDGKLDGYREYDFDSDGDSINIFFGLWRAEEEIKQVVAALREVFK